MYSLHSLKNNIYIENCNDFTFGKNNYNNAKLLTPNTTLLLYFQDHFSQQSKKNRAFKSVFVSFCRFGGRRKETKTTCKCS